MLSSHRGTSNVLVVVGLVVVISLPEFSSNTNPKWPVIYAFSHFSNVVWMANICCVFRVKPPFSNFSRVDYTYYNQTCIVLDSKKIHSQKVFVISLSSWHDFAHTFFRGCLGLRLAIHHSPLDFTPFIKSSATETERLYVQPGQLCWQASL